MNGFFKITRITEDEYVRRVGEVDGACQEVFWGSAPECLYLGIDVESEWSADIDVEHLMRLEVQTCPEQ